MGNKIDEIDEIEFGVGEVLVYSEKGYVPAKDATPLKKSSRFTHCTFRVRDLEALAAIRHDATLALLIHLVRVWFQDFQRNPIVLTRAELNGVRMSKFVKARALANLKKAGFVSVEQRPGKSPLVTLKWKQIKCQPS
jgi:hypothetical protein